jgi:hypothetical protein
MNSTLRTFFGIAIFLILATIPSTAQVTFKIGGGLGAMLPAGDLGGSTTDYYSGTKYGVGTGINLNGKAKVGLIGFNLTGEVDYSSLSNSGNSEAGQGSVDVSTKIFSLKVGPEFRLSVPLAPIVPYIGINIALNEFTGETTFQGVSKVPSGTYAQPTESRIGLGVYAGTEVSVGPFMAIDFNLSYNLMNLSGSTWNSGNAGGADRINSYLALNDSPDPLYAAGDDKHFISGSRSINTILFTTSILFGL